MSNSADFSNRVREYRGREGINQAEFAKRMGISRNYVSMVESGRKPSAQVVRHFELLEGPSQERPAASEFATDPRGMLKRRREELGMTRSELAQRARYRAVYISDVEEGRARPNEKFLRKVCKILGLPLEELMAGSDQPPLAGEGITFGATPRIKLTAGLDARTIPLISMAQAGELRSYEDIYDYEGVVDYAPKGAKTFAVKIRGDSMSPRFPDGTIAIVEPDREVRSEKLVIARLREGSVLFKHLQIQGDDFRLISLNPVFPPITVPRSEMEWIYRVVRTQETHE